jgi:glycosyltransferase involved in cell wall biosynthesis
MNIRNSKNCPQDAEGLVSVIIPVHNRKKAAVCIDCVRKQDYSNIEIIPVDFQGFPAEKRNYGFKQSQGEYIFHLDEDLYPPSNTISESVKVFNLGFDIVAIDFKNVEPKTYMDKCHTIWESTLNKMAANLLPDTKRISFFRREVLEKLGPLDERYVFLDDYVMLMQAVSRKYTIGLVYKSKVCLVHDETRTLKSNIFKARASRKAWYQVSKDYGVNLTAYTNLERKRVFRLLMKNPVLIPGVSLILSVMFVIRRIP